MSQNKTIVPGVDYTNLGDADQSIYGDLYSRTSNSSEHTFVPGMQEAAPPVPAAAGTPMQSVQPQQEGGRLLTMQERVVVGTLFSISKTLLGELFPLYLGKNIIGTAPTCDVMLSEGSVSEGHAILYIRKVGDGYEATITDFNSANGTKVNDSDVRFETLPVKENDVIAIGSHYKFLVKFFCMDRYGLDEDPDFDATGQQMNTSGTSAEGFYSPSANNDNNRTVIG